MKAIPCVLLVCVSSLLVERAVGGTGFLWLEDDKPGYYKDRIDKMVEDFSDRDFKDLLRQFWTIYGLRKLEKIDERFVEGMARRGIRLVRNVAGGGGLVVSSTNMCDPTVEDCETTLELEVPCDPAEDPRCVQFHHPHHHVEKHFMPQETERMKMYKLNHRDLFEDAHVVDEQLDRLADEARFLEEFGRDPVERIVRLEELGKQHQLPEPIGKKISEHQKTKKSHSDKLRDREEKLKQLDKDLQAIEEWLNLRKHDLTNQ